jgi:hypothetical protein
MIEPWVEIHGISIHRGDAHIGDEANDNPSDYEVESPLLRPIQMFSIDDDDHLNECFVLVPFDDNPEVND